MNRLAAVRGREGQTKDPFFLIVDLVLILVSEVAAINERERQRETGRERERRFRKAKYLGTRASVTAPTFDDRNLSTTGP